MEANFKIMQSIKKNDELVIFQQKLTNQIQTLSDNRKIYNGASRLEWLEHNLEESNNRIKVYQNLIKSKEEKLVLLRQSQNRLLKEKSELDKKGFFDKMISNKKINENAINLSDLNVQIEKIELEVSMEKDVIEYTKKQIEQLTNDFLSRYGLKDMTLEDYKKRLELITPNIEKMTDFSLQKKLEKKLKTLEQKKIEFGLTLSQKVSAINMEEYDTKKEYLIYKNNLIGERMNLKR